MIPLRKLAGAGILAALAACSPDLTAPRVSSSPASLDKASASSGNTVVVTEADIARQIEDTPPTRSWVFYSRVATPATGAFVTGPGNPPAGVGSFSMDTPLPTDKGTLFNFDHIGTALGSINAISYSTYRQTTSTAPANVAPSINIQVDYNGPAAGGFTTLVFEPVYNPTQGAVQDGVWQTWDAYNGVWWSTRDIPGVCARDCFVRWSDIVAANPNAVILGGFGVNQGSGNGGLFASTDALTLGVNGDRWIYDFEPFKTPAGKDDCKNGGWEILKAADGSSFKNQGQCIKYTERSREFGD